MREALVYTTRISVLVFSGGGCGSNPLADCALEQRINVAVPILWRADYETGDLCQWGQAGQIARDGSEGGIYNSGDARVQITEEMPHSGRYSAKLIIETPPKAGVRLHRFVEPYTRRPLFFSAWYYVEAPYAITGSFWMLMQFKSRSGDRNDPFFSVQVVNDPGGALVVLKWSGEVVAEGPYPGDKPGINLYGESAQARLPIGRWFHLEAFLRQSGQFDGEMQLWLDGQEIAHLEGVRTHYPESRNNWGVTNYANGVAPSPTIVRTDDAVISSERIATR